MIDSFRSFAQDDSAHFILSTQGCPNHCPWCCQPQTQAIRKPKHRLMSLLPQILDKSKGKARKSMLVTGGEPLLHADALAEFGQTLKKRGFILNINTSGCVRHEALANLSSSFCHFSHDLKHIDPSIHKKVIGSELESALESLRHLASLPTHLLVRPPVVRDLNDSESVIQRIMDFVETLGNAKYQIFPVRVPEKAPDRDFAPQWIKFRKLEGMAERRMGGKYEPYFGRNFNKSLP